MEMVEFWTVCAANGIILDDIMRQQIQRYAKELKYWNEKLNLISRKDEDHILDRHILHSLSVLKYIDIPPKAKCLDIGTGGGLPGIPIAIANPTVRMLLVDSIKKKIKITGVMADHTGLRNLKARNARVEDLQKENEHKKKYDFIFARAVTKTDNIVNWVKDLIKPNAKIVLLKGGNLKDEIAETNKYNPGYNIKEIEIDMFGADWFKSEDKKILILQKK